MAGDGEGPDGWCKAGGLAHAYPVSLLLTACLFGFTAERLGFKPLYPMPEDQNKMSGGQLNPADDLPQLQEEKEEVLNEGGGKPAGCHGVLNWRPINGPTGHRLSLISEPSIRPLSR